MKVPITADQAITAGELLLGINVVAAQQLSSFAGNQVFELRLRDRLAYLKLGANAETLRDLRREVAVVGYVRSRGVLAPAVEAFDESGEAIGVPCAVLADVGGHPLSGTEPVFGRVGACLRALHDMRAIGFGAVSARGDLVGDDGSWRQTLEQPAAGLPPAVHAGLVDGGLLTRARNAIDRFAPAIDGVTDARLIHGDFCPRHVYARVSQITGIIDWGDAMAGDPAYDFGRLLHSAMRTGGIDQGRSVVSAVLRTYGDSPWLTGPRDPKILFYAAMFTLSSMQGEFLSGAPWPPFWPANAATLTMILNALDAEAGPRSMRG
jgi:aminoglycoside phosphotransferase (APT) family kinase protein